jgi:subtilisin-like proprotein convertase family protein/V8-like Glu-specific endopeptidase
VFCQGGHLNRRIVLLLSVFLFLAACAKETAVDLATSLNDKENDEQMEKQVIYGDDNRIENYPASEALKTLAASTVALVQSSSLIKNSQGKFDLVGSNFGDKHHLCVTEPFREQTIGAFCSGSLVGPDTLITAGHCITNANDCAGTRFVFDFAIKAPGIEKKSFSNDEVYSCKEIIRRAQLDSGSDFAVIRLDRAVVGKVPLSFRKNGSVNLGDSLFVIGHPSGLPQKIAGGAQVRSIQSEFFTANLDTYGGNSGSAVFNANSKEIEGILVRGDTDFTWSGSCSVSYRCANNSCRGEDVTRIDQVARYIPVVSTPSTASSVFSVLANLAIPDSPKAGIVSSVAVNATPAGRKVQVRLDLTHTYRGDLVLELVSPSGKSVLLQNRSGGSLQNIQGVYGVDLASAQSLSLMSTESKTGTWSLKVTDKAAVDVGVLKQWALIFTN